MDKPVVLLDVDGVINVSRPGWGTAPFSARAIVDGEQFKLRWAPALIDRINRLSEVADIRWCASWCPYISEIELLMKIGPFPVEWEEKISLQDVNDYKWRSILKHTGDGRKVIWIDDEIDIICPPDSESREIPHLVFAVRPKANRGLSPELMDLVERVSCL